MARSTSEGPRRKAELPATSVSEPERYELRELPRHHFELQRRDFFKFVGGGAVVLFSWKTVAFGQGPGGQAVPQEISAWLHVGENGKVTVFTGKVEIGQNAHTALAQLVAEELRVPFGAVEMVMGDTARTPYDFGTVGSQTTAVMGLQLRRAAAAARGLIAAKAAEVWNVDAKRLVLDRGQVSDPATGRSESYGELLKRQQFTQTISADETLAPPSDWKIAGVSVPKVDASAFVTGGHKYAADIKRQGMLHGRIVRPSAIGATLESVDTGAAEAMPGVTVVQDGDFIGVAAPKRSVAERAAAAIKASWKETPQPSNDELFEYLKNHAHPVEGTGGGRPGTANVAEGSIERGLAAADHKLQQTYTVRYIQHAPLEPRAAVAEWDGDQLTVWTGTQRPFGVREELSRAFRLAPENVRVIATENNPCYGGKHTGEYAVEAARLALAAKKPVKLIWTREEEFTWAYFRPAGVIEVRSGVTKEGKLTAWEFHNYNSGNAAVGTPYRVANQLVQFHPTDYPLRQGSYRGLAATANHFARESHMDELARAANLDPLEFRRKNLDDARLLNVFEAAAKRFNWGATKSAGQGFGLGGGTEKGGYVATCAEVTVDMATGAVKVVRVVTAYECGAIVNPNHLQAQIEGAMMYGLGGALFEEILFDDGHIRNPHFAQYRLPRFSDVPAIEVVLVDRKDLEPAGAGETPMFGLAPAIANAIFDATGIRLRGLPLAPKGVAISKT